MPGPRTHATPSPGVAAGIVVGKFGPATVSVDELLSAIP